jgi:hypothetical protein
MLTTAPTAEPLVREPQPTVGAASQLRAVALSTRFRRGAASPQHIKKLRRNRFFGSGSLTLTAVS